MNQFLKTESDIKFWLDHMEIENYQLLSDQQHGLIVDVGGDVDLSDKDIHAIPVKFNHVKGYFDCSNNRLTNLLGSPKSVGGYFRCDFNQIVSLEGITPNIGGSLICSQNLLSNLKFFPSFLEGSLICDNNQLTSLLGAPQKLHGDFSCRHNLLKNLEHCPNIAESFFCDHNQLIDLLYCPQIISSNNFYCYHNPGLGNTQNIQNFEEILQIHFKTKSIRDEQENLSNAITPYKLRSKKKHKI